jgi:hypothetical protein
MSTWGKAITLMLVAVFLTVILLVPSIANAQTTSYYGGGYYGEDSGVNPAAFTLTVYSPNNQTVYANTMLLKFNITWTTYPKEDFDFAPPLSGDYAYSIDNNSFVSIASNQSASDLFYTFTKNNFTINPSFSYLVNVFNLANGYHKIVIKASLYYSSVSYSYFNRTSIPTLFLVQNPTPSPTPHSAIGALLSPLTITIIGTVVVLVAVIVSLLFYRRHRKTTKTIISPVFALLHEG